MTPSSLIALLSYRSCAITFAPKPCSDYRGFKMAALHMERLITCIGLHEAGRAALVITSCML